MSNPSDNNSGTKDVGANQAGNNSSQSIAIEPVQFEAIKPTEVPLTTVYSSDNQEQPGNSSAAAGEKKISDIWRQHRLLMVSLPLLVLALLAVIFILPSQVQPPDKEATGSPAETTTEITKKTITSKALPNGPAESPWTDAQFAKQRRETQDILAKLLDRQQALEGIHVDQWAAETFAQANATAAEADSLYRQQHFDEAKASYQQALSQFDQLIEDSEKIFTDSIDLGNKALTNGSSQEAKQHFQLAALIHPESTEASNGLQRSEVLDQVLTLLRQGSRLQLQGELDQAKDIFQQALALDQDSAATQTKLADINAAIRERDYAKAMSLGFAAMNQGKFDGAISHFQQALTIKPGADDAQAAIVQAKNQRTQNSLQTYINKAIAAENDEQWQQAVDNYEQALKLDGNLVPAKVGKIKAVYRANIDKRLTDILENPDRLTSSTVFEEYRQLGREVRDMSERGPRLQQQFEQLEQAMRRAIAPVQVTLQSDNQTEVTIYQVGKLGKFERQQLTLKPGTYTVVGTRPGYRDVRKEITISSTTPNSPVVVQCTEAINLNAINNG